MPWAGSVSGEATRRECLLISSSPLDNLNDRRHDGVVSSLGNLKGATVVAQPNSDALDKVDVPQGTLELMILTILAREPRHGYGISQRLTALSHDHFRVNPGSLFPSLYRLEQDGKLKAEWRPSENNRNAKYYALTASGRRQLDQHRRRWERISFAITSVLEGA
jgi:transcriptional regulator